MSVHSLKNGSLLKIGKKHPFTEHILPQLAQRENIPFCDIHPTLYPILSQHFSKKSPMSCAIVTAILGSFTF
ncbi:MAG: hypothetical protein ACK5C0_00840 [Candidatus Kapaibacterium sp.]|jgi:hypothetical protein